MRGFCGYCSVASNENRRFDLLVGLANDQSIMGDHSQEEQALMKIQHEWAEARVKGDSSYTRRIEADDCTIVWPDGRIVNKRGDLQSMTGDIVFTEFKIDDLLVRLYGDTGIVVGEGIIKAHKGKQDLLGGKFVWTDTYVKQGGQWKVVASQITPVLEN
jgi:ketosteroid isomerase-like protein